MFWGHASAPLRGSQNVPPPLILSRFQLLSLGWRLCPCVLRTCMAHHSNINYFLSRFLRYSFKELSSFEENIIIQGNYIHSRKYNNLILRKLYSSSRPHVHSRKLYFFNNIAFAVIAEIHYNTTLLGFLYQDLPPNLQNPMPCSKRLGNDHNTIKITSLLPPPP